MNSDTQKQTILKIALVAGVGCLAWLFLVKPEQQSMQDQDQTIQSQESLIAAYQQQVGTFESGESLLIKNRLEEIVGTMSSVDPMSDSGTMLHNLINESASKNGVSVSRIESVNARELSLRVEGLESEVTGINHIVRVEFEGEYSSVLSFMGEVVSGPVQVKFVSFRFVPTGFDTIRANAEISSVILTSILADAGTKGIANE